MRCTEIDRTRELKGTIRRYHDLATVKPNRNTGQWFIFRYTILILPTRILWQEGLIPTMTNAPRKAKVQSAKNKDEMTDIDTGTGRPTGGQPVQSVASSQLPTMHGQFRMVVYRALDDAVEHVALVMGELHGKENVLVRVHSECLTGDVFGSQRCDCGAQLDYAMTKISEAGAGAVIYLRGHEGRGIGLANKILAYQLQDKGFDTVEANLELGLPVDDRDYQAAATILQDMGIVSIRLMTNNPIKLAKLHDCGLTIAERVAVLTQRTAHNGKYLDTKRQKLGHMLDSDPHIP